MAVHWPSGDRDDFGFAAAPAAPSAAAVAGLAVVQVLAAGGQSLLIVLSQLPSGGYGYDPSSAVVLSELAKLAISLATVLLSGQFRRPPRAAAPELPGLPGGSSPSRRRSGAAAGQSPWRLLLRGSLVYVVPAMLSVIHNNLVFVAHVYLSAPVYQLLHNIKVVAAGVVYRVILRRQLLVVQWMALLQLAAALACSAWAAPGGAAGAPAWHEHLLQRGPSAAVVSSWHVGLLLMVLLALCSALAGVHAELLLKTSGVPLQVGSVWLHGYGVLAAALACLGARQPERSFFEGYTGFVWAVVLTHSVLGYAASFALRRGGDAVKLLGASLVVPATALASGPLLQQHSGPGLWLAHGQAVCALCLFYGDQRLLYSADAALLPDGCCRRSAAAAAAAECPKTV